jgi:UDP-2,3-diacylglucosamine pyrophosphatase LpxH
MTASMRMLGVSLVMSLLCMLPSCDNSDPIAPDAGIDPFSDGGNMMVVISDIHLGADLAYAECKENLGALARLLGQIRVSPNVKELVIAGDLLDEWFVPATVDTYQGQNQADFVERIASANTGVIDALNSIIQDGTILVTYVPGNHDLTITADNVDRILPGIHQARDEAQGLGTYSSVDYPGIAIEHGHRYNFFCAPDPISNQAAAPGAIMPPGYFFTRIAALHVAQGEPAAGDTIPLVTPNTVGDESQNQLFGYWTLWAWAINYFTIENQFDEKMIVTNVGGFTETYSVNDLLPYQTTAGGLIDVTLYRGIQDTWDERQTHNNVAVHIPTAQAIANANSASESDDQARIQYFDNPQSDKRIVIFGHTHAAKIQSHSHDEQKAIYANSGTWIDGSQMTFVVITPQSASASSQTYVKLYKFEGEVVTKTAEDSLRY